MRRPVACIAVAICLGTVWVPERGIELQAVSERLSQTTHATTAVDLKALEEMLGNPQRPRRWSQAPALTVLEAVMVYRPGKTSEYVATAERLSHHEIVEIVSDLTEGLGVLSAHTFKQFSSVTELTAPAGSTVSVARPHHIVAGRFKGLRNATKAIGLGGRRTEDGAIMAGLIILDNDYDRTHASRRLLRMHELGHALGYDHVRSRPSIMNLRIGNPPNDFDREAALVAFRSAAFVSPLNPFDSGLARPAGSW